MADTLADRIRKSSPALSVGILTADLMKLGSEISILEAAGIQLMHIDVMDGCYCPMMTLGPPFIKAVKTTLLKDVHLMIQDPLDKLESYIAAGADMITIHPESCRHPHRVLQALSRMTNSNDSSRGILRGIALNPGTSLEAVEPMIDEVEMIFLLAVNPGWGGQKFIAPTKQRIARLLQMIRDSKRNILVGVDGGITADNLADVARMGADIIVTGSAVFDGKDPAGNVKRMLNILNNGQK